MEKQKLRHSILPVIVSIVILPSVLVIAYVYFASSVSGMASLPSGLTAAINGPFSASENAGRTSVEACGRKFVFTPAVVIVDGTAVARLDASVIQVAIDARGYDAQLSLNGQHVSLPPR
jgi:hypothetical protein